MAYINQEEEEQNVPSVNVLGNVNQTGSQTPQNTPNTAPTPAPVPTPAPMQQTPPAPSAPPVGTNTAPAPSPTPLATPASQPRATQPRASSGMFTNIRKYIDANRPQAGRMADAAAQTFGRTSQNLQKDVQNKENIYQTQAQQKQGLIENERQFATDITERIVGTQTPQAPAEGETEQPLYQEDEYGRVRDVLTGNKTFSNLQALNLNKEQNKLQELINKADASENFQGRTALLSDTFGNQGRAYTRGQQGLDSLILQGDEAATNRLISGVQDQSGQAKGLIGDARRDALRTMSQYDTSRGNIKGDISNIIKDQGISTVSSQVDQTVEEQMAQRQVLADQLGVSAQELDQYLTETGQGFDPASRTKNYYDQKYMRGGYSEGILGAEVDTSDIDQLAFDAAAFNRGSLLQDTWLNSERMRSSFYLPSLKDAAAQKGEGFKDLLTQGRNQEEIDQLLGNVYNTYSGDVSDQYTGRADRTREDLGTANYSRERGFDNKGRSTNRVKGVTGYSGGKAVTSGITGGDEALDKLTSLRQGEDVSRQTAATTQDIARYNALQNLVQGENLGEREFKQHINQAGSAQRETEDLRSFYENLLSRLNTARG